jgi:hypothetical protein
VGWKTQSILIRPAFLENGPDNLLADLGYERRLKGDETPFSRAGGASIWIGSIEDCIVMVTPFAGNFFDDDSVADQDFIAFRNALFRRFPGADVAAFLAHSVVAQWGFAVFRGGTLVRRKHGADGITFCDEGSRLPVEEAYIARFQRVETEGETKYKDPNHPEYDELTEADLGEMLIQEVGRSFTGVPLDALNIPGTQFCLNDDEARFRPLRRRFIKPRRRPWWKFW